jgi:hypothetical protein
MAYQTPEISLVGRAQDVVLEDSFLGEKDLPVAECSGIDENDPTAGYDRTEVW